MSFLKAIGGPGSPGFLAVGSALGLLLLATSSRTRRTGRMVLLSLVATYLVLSLPWVAGLIVCGLPRWNAAVPDRIQQLFVLEGDNQGARAATACRLFAEHRPHTVWVIGGDELRDELAACGVPRDKLQLGWDGGGSTILQMRSVKLHASPPDPGMAIVVSRVQLPRVAALAHAAGLDIPLVSSPVDREPARSGIRRFLPSLAALALSRDATYEIVAYSYYRLNGWI